MALKGAVEAYLLILFEEQRFMLLKMGPSQLVDRGDGGGAADHDPLTVLRPG